MLAVTWRWLEAHDRPDRLARRRGYRRRSKKLAPYRLGGAQCPTPQPRLRWSALAAGLADAVHPAEELLDAALALAGRIAERPWRALELTKLALRAHRPATTAFDVAAQALLFEGEDKRERMRAFLAEGDRPHAERGRR
jgi:hypothetical protein